MMSVSVPDLKQMEKRAFRLFHQDGVMDMYLGLLLILIGLQEHFLDGFGPAVRIPVMTAGFVIAWFLFWATKKWITTPRLGQVKFGQNRKARAIRMVILMCFSVLLNIVLLILTIMAKTRPELGWFLYLGSSVVPIGVGTWMTLLIIVFGYFTENSRLMYYAVFWGGSFTAAMLLNTALPYILVGTAIFLIGLYVFTRFLKDYPVIKADGNEGE
jgi:hypothetical protein